jgi:hypothetical protein
MGAPYGQEGYGWCVMTKVVGIYERRCPEDDNAEIQFEQLENIVNMVRN